MKKKRVLILYYSYSSQTRNLIQAFGRGLEENDIEITWQPLKPIEKLNFPLGSVASTITMMVETFFRKRIPIEPIEQGCYLDWDLIILAGPTWSYNPSGPVLSLFDRFGTVFKERRVLPLISCRGYWRVHYWVLRYMLKKKGAEVLKPLIFLHTGAEPWRTIGVFLKLAGKIPESGKSWISRYYQKYGHNREQIDYAAKLGHLYAKDINNESTFENTRVPPVKNV